MEIVLFILMILIFFWLGYYMVDHIGRFLDEHYCSYQEPRLPNKKIYITGAEDRNEEYVYTEINDLFEMMPDSEEYKIIVHRPIDPNVVENLKESGYLIEYESSG